MEEKDILIHHSNAVGGFDGSYNLYFRDIILYILYMVAHIGAKTIMGILTYVKFGSLLLNQ